MDLRRIAVAMQILATFAMFANAQVGQPQTADAPAKLISKDDAIRIALAYNQSLRANRLNVDESKAQEVTASLKPNPTLSLGADGFPLFSPKTIRFGTQGYSVDLSYTVERGGKREKRTVVA